MFMRGVVVMTLKGVFDFRIPFAFNFSVGTDGNVVAGSS